MPPPTNNPAPTTNLTTAYNELGNVYDPQVQQVQQQQAQVTQQAQVSQNQLDQAKTNAFTNNALTSNARGIMYSGYTPLTNNSYVTNTYNPNVQKLQTNTANQQQTLTQKIASINQERSNAAETLVQQTQQAQAQAAANAARATSRSYGGSTATGSSSPGLPSTAQVRIAINQGLSSVKGGDGYVSPQDYASALGDWLAAGQSRSSFNNEFKNYRNPNNAYYDYAIKVAGL